MQNGQTTPPCYRPAALGTRPITFADVGRLGLLKNHSVFRVYDIPPAAYFAPIANSREGDVSTTALWDEPVDEPVAYPFYASGQTEFCYMPNFWEPRPSSGGDPARRTRLPCDMNNTILATRPVQADPSCSFTCKWQD
jgi:hypothetical protein